jgi:cyanophycinase
MKKYISENIKGNLVLIGGSENKKKFLQDIIEVNNAQNILIIPSASMYPEDVFRDYECAYESLNIDVKLLDVHKKSNKKSDLKKIENSDIIYFTGGDQVRLVDIFEDTSLIDAIYDKFKNGSTIVGTSAGASALSEIMIYDERNQVEHNKGFGFIKNIIIDTHFINRKRLTRVSKIIYSKICDKAIGLAENTGIIINSDEVLKVIGTGIVTTLKILKDNRLSIKFLKEGNEFNLNTWNEIKHS